MPSIPELLGHQRPPGLSPQVDMDFDNTMSGIAGLHRHYNELRGVENSKNKLIENLLERVDAITIQYEQIRLDKERETDYNRSVQRQQAELYKEIAQLKASMERDAFLLVLLDGDGMLFDDELVNQGEAGGREAAARLTTFIREHVQQTTISKTMPNIPSDYKIVVKIYANLRGLADAYFRSGVCAKPHVVEDFARGFTGAKQLFDFIDVGSGKDRADDKIGENFKLNLHNVHCRHVLLGCAHDNGYARLLEDVGDETVYGRVTLIEGVPFGRELFELSKRYRAASSDELFRKSKLVIPTQDELSRRLYPQQSNEPMVQMYPGPGTPSPTLAHSAKAVPPPNRPLNPTVSSWASAAAAPSTAPSPSVASVAVTEPRNAVSRNIKGQRVDAEIRYNPDEFMRIKKMKMCNVHYLRGDCAYPNSCTHDHAYKPNKNELAVLAQVARQTSCRFGTACDEPKCIYGHR
ncbi:hypothetical protein MMC25_003778 [Agyrium rufum]|nr:hypothetical protein [Agyrium rufum]